MILSLDISVENKNEIAIYQTETGALELRADTSTETLWANLEQIAALFERDKSVISRHLKNIFKEGELNKEVVVAFFATTPKEGEGLIIRWY